MRHNYNELEIWGRSIKLVKAVYRLTKTFPIEENYGLRSQLRRAVVSVPSNIAEGCGRDTNPQVSHFINIALGSLCEVETQLIISLELKYIEKTEGAKLIEETNQLKKMSRSFLRYLK